MLLLVTEKCLTLDEKDKEYYGLRTYQYEANGDTFLKAIIDMEENFDTDNIIENSNEDDFPGECLDSEVITVERCIEE